MLFSHEKKIAGESSQPVLVNDQASLAGLANQETLLENQQPILKDNILNDGIPKNSLLPVTFSASFKMSTSSDQDVMFTFLLDV